jgi:flagellar motility protein MotE (MotC chaperone)
MNSRILYVIVPVLAIIAFLFFYNSESERIRNDAVAAAAQKAAAEKAAEDERARLRAAAMEKARQLEEQRNKEEDDKRRKKEKEFEDGIKVILDEGAKYRADADKYKQEAAELEKELEALRTRKQNLSRDSIEMNREIAYAIIARNNAELEVHRYAEMVAQKANESSLTKLPPPPTTAAK